MVYQFSFVEKSGIFITKNYFAASSLLILRPICFEGIFQIEFTEV